MTAVTHRLCMCVCVHLQHGDLIQVCAPFLHARHDVLNPAGALTARRALTAALMPAKSRRVDEMEMEMDNEHNAAQQTDGRVWRQLQLQ